MKDLAVKGLTITLILGLLLGMVAGPSVALASSGDGSDSGDSPPSYTVSNPAVVIKVTPNNTSQTAGVFDSADLDTADPGDYLQGDMEVSWQNNGESDVDIDNPLEFKIEDSLTLNNDSNNEAAAQGLGIQNTDSDSGAKIESKYIQVKKESQDSYSSLDSWVEVLGTAQDSQSLEFRLDTGALFEDKDWENVPAGVYKGNITPSIGLLGSSENRLTAMVIVETVVELSVPDKLEMVIEKPVEDESVSKGWDISTNGEDLNLKFESSGIEKSNSEETGDTEEDTTPYGSYFRYFIEDGNDSEASFGPGGSTEVGYTAGTLKLKYSPDEFGGENWYELNAGEYEDTVTITVSSND